MRPPDDIAPSSRRVALQVGSLLKRLKERVVVEPAALDPAGMAVLCFQSYVVKTPHHTILVDACIGNDKSFPHRPSWHRKSDSSWMQALKAAGVTVDDIDFVMCTHLH